MNANELLQHYLADCPLVAIIRGVKPDEVEAIGEAAYESGIKIIEVPLNSPQPLESIARLAKRFGERMLVGAGTVLEVEDVKRVRDVGGRIIVSPDAHPAIIAAAASAGLVSSPGYFTPSDAFAAIRAGATALKLFPAEGASPAVLKAHRAVLPADLPILVVGGIQPDNMGPWKEAGATGFGLGSGLYRPGRSPAETLERGRAYVAAVKPA